MGGQGSGRKPDPIKRLIGFNQPANTDLNPSLYIPNYSGVKHEIKDGTSSINTDDLAEGSVNLYSQWDNVTNGIEYEGNVEVKMNDNLSSSFKLSQGANNYMCVDTTNGSEAINFGCLTASHLLKLTASQIAFSGAAVTINRTGTQGALNIQQSADYGTPTTNAGLNVFGYDDKKTSSASVAVDSAGNAWFYGTGSVWYRGGANVFYDAGSATFSLSLASQNAAKVYLATGGGNVMIGAAVVPSAKLQISGGAFAMANTTEPSTINDNGQLFVSGGALYYKGAGGTTTKLADS